MAISTEHTGAMIALIPSDADLDRLAIDNGEPRDELHLTLYYLGEAADITPETQHGMITAVGVMMKSRDQSEVHGRAFGVAHWNPNGEDPAWVLNVSELPDDERDGATMSYVRGSVTEALYDGKFDVDMPVQHAPWQPHICLAYSTDDRSADLRGRLGDVTFDRIRFAFGSEVTDVPLGQAAKVSSALGGSIVSDSETTVEETDATVAVLAASKPKPKPKPDAEDCPPGNRTLPDGSCLSEEEYAVESQWEGVLVVEGITTGDGREFAPNALTWADHALLRWQKEGSHGGDHDVTVSVGRIDQVWRVGAQVIGRGVLNLESTDGFEIYRRMKNGFAGGISIDADDIMDADVEFIWPEPSGDAPEGGDDADMLLSMLFGSPEKMIFHGGRVRAATLVDIPAFVEAYISLSGGRETEQLVASATTGMTCDNRVVLPHAMSTSDDAWDGIAASRRLPNVMPVELAREAYALVADQPTRVGKIDCGYLHHEIGDDGKVTAANLTACSVGIAALGSDDALSPAERRAIYAHLASHLRDANQEPPPLVESDVVVAASVATMDEWRPDSTWFSNPRLNVPVGITVTDQGRVYGHAAQWGECHIGYEDLCVTPPHEDAHPYFMTGEMVCADGARVAVGQITLGTGHAPLNYRASRAVEHYDNTGSVVADVAVGNDEHGIWVAGAIRANAAASRVHELRASGQVSGDWRRIGNQLRLVGLLAVNVPGFPVPRLRARVAGGAPTALIAAGQTSVGRGGLVAAVVDTEAPDVTGRSEEELNSLAMRRVMSLMAQRVHGERQTEGV